MSEQIDAQDVVMSCVSAINPRGFQRPRQFAADDMSFVGVMGSRQGGDIYFKDMERMRLNYDVKKVFVDGSDVCLFYDLAISTVNIFVVAWYQVTNGKIQSLKVVFDPRTVLEAQAKQSKMA